MKLFNLSLSLATTVLVLASQVKGAENEVALSDLARAQGIWKSEFKDDAGNDRVGYRLRWLNEPFQVMRALDLTVDKATKKVLSHWAGFVNVDPSQQQFQGLYFSTEGWVGESSGVPTDKGFVMQVSVTGTNRSHFHVTIHEDYQSDTAFTSAWKNLMTGGNYVEQGEVRQFRKVEQTFSELRESGAFVFPEVAEPIDALAPFARLVGRWRSVDSAGATTHDLRWNLRMEKKWLVERWQIGGESGSGGFNVSGVDPITGMLTLWSVRPNFMGKIGSWDVLSGNVLGQVEGNSRVIREFPNDDTFKAHWQYRSAGSFVDVPADQARSYTAKRVTAQD